LINELSIVIPSLNEEKNIPNLLSEIQSSLSLSKIKYEVIIIDDFSEIKLEDVIEESKNIKVIRNDVNLGQTKSIQIGIENSKYRFICTLDGDGQNPPKEILKLLNYFNDNFNSTDAVVGYRKNRQDKLSRKILSKTGNFIVGKITRTKFKDLGCSLKIFKKVDANYFQLSGDIHRIFNILLYKNGLSVKEIGVEHFPRKFGETNYSYRRILPVIVDAVLIYLTNGFQKSSRYVLGKISFIFLTLSTIFLILSLYQKYSLDRYVIQNPLFLLFLMSFFISVQIFVSIVITFFLENTKK
jgi:glycosyltransferase involved in cell wall biosynthesis